MAQVNPLHGKVIAMIRIHEEEIKSWMAQHVELTLGYLLVPEHHHLFNIVELEGYFELEFLGVRITPAVVKCPCSTLFVSSTAAYNVGLLLSGLWVGFQRGEKRLGDFINVTTKRMRDALPQN